MPGVFGPVDGQWVALVDRGIWPAPFGAVRRVRVTRVPEKLPISVLPRLAVRIVGPGLLPFVEELLDGPTEGSLSAGGSVRRVVVGDCFGLGAEVGFQDQEMYWDIGTEVEQLVSGRPAWGGLLIPSRQ